MDLQAWRDSTFGAELDSIAQVSLAKEASSRWDTSHIVSITGQGFASAHDEALGVEPGSSNGMEVDSAGNLFVSHAMLQRQAFRAVM